MCVGVEEIEAQRHRLIVGSASADAHWVGNESFRMNLAVDEAPLTCDFGRELGCDLF